MSKILIAKSLLILIILLKSTYGNVEDYEITCKDENGKNVDWYYLYKLPMSFTGKKGSSGNKKGFMYAYIASNSSNEEFTLSDRSVNNLDSMPGQTLAQAYFKSKKVDRLVIAYNDHPPNQIANSQKGHLKGVVVADKRSGFWLVHSVPRYPYIGSSSNKYYYPPTATKFGQSFLCLSLNAEQINVVGNQLVYNEPQLYESKLPKKFEKVYPNIERLIKLKGLLKNGSFSNQANIITLNNQIFTSFATSLYVQTWRRGNGNSMASNCSKTTRVWNISKLKIDEKNSFPTTADHSKWGVSDDKSDYICIGDINRMSSQTRRGGGTVCHRSKPISDTYRSLIADFEPCPKNNFRTLDYTNTISHPSETIRLNNFP